jgi:hypothetical protein
MKKLNKNKFQQLVDKNKIVLLADLRSPVDFRNSHLSNAVNLPLKNFTNKIMGMPRDSLIVAYSTSFDDIDLVQGFNYAEQLGFTKLYVAEYEALK